MSNPIFDNAPEYDSDLDTLADFVIEPTTVHIPPPPSPAPNTCLCGRTTRDDDSDEPLYCSEACARLDAFHALTARSRSNSLAPTPVTTAPATPLFNHTPLRESLAGLFARPDSISSPLSTPLSASSFASMDTVPLPLEMSSHYRRVTAKRERMERASEERSRSHSRTHSKARPSLSELEEEHHVETHVEREDGSDGAEYLPAPTTVQVHIAVNVQVEHQDRREDDCLDVDQLSCAFSASVLSPAPGVTWRDPFADPTVSSPTRESSVAPHDVPSGPPVDLRSIASEDDFSPFNAYAPVVVHPSGLPSRKSSVCFAGVGPAGHILSPLRSRAPSNASPSPAFNLAEKPLPLPPVDPDAAPSEAPRELPKTPIESAESSSACEPSTEVSDPLPSPGPTLDLPSPMPSFDMPVEPTTPTSSTAPASPCTPNGRTQQTDFDPQVTPSRSAIASHVSSSTEAPEPTAPARPGTPLRRAPRRLQTLDALPRATIFSMVLDPELDVLSGRPGGPPSAPAALKRVETAPELYMGRDAGFHHPALSAHISPETPRKDRRLQTRTRATSTPRRPEGMDRRRTSSTPMHPGMLHLKPKTPRRARVYAPPPTPPVSPSHVSSPRPPVGQDPGSWQSFGAVFDAWGWNAGEAQSSFDEQAMGFHRRQESGESTGSSATDASWSSSSYGVPGSSVCSWTVTGATETETGTGAYAQLRACSPATSSVRTIIPPPRGSSLAAEGDDEHVHLHLCHTHRSRRQSSIAALDSILAMEDTFWTEPVVVRDAEDSMDGEGVAPGVQFRGDANGFAFPAKDKPMPPLRIAGLSRPPSVANLPNPNTSDTSGLRVRCESSTAKHEHLAPPTIDLHAHRASASQFPVSPSIASAGPSPEADIAPSPMPAYVSSTSLFDAPMTASPLLGTPALSRGSPALPNGSPISANFALRTPSSPYLSVPSSLSRRTSRSNDASSVLLRTASAARLAAALNAANEDEADETVRLALEDHSFARYSPGMGHSRRSGSLGRGGSLSGSSPAMGLGLALGEYESRARSSSEPWNGVIPGSILASGVVAPGTMSRSGSRMNLMDPSVLVVPEEEEEEEEDYGQVVSTSKFDGIAVAPTTPSMEDTSEASPLIDAFPHPMGGYFPGSRYASRANTPVKGLHTSGSALSLRQVAMGNASQENAQNATGQDQSDGEDEEVVATVQRMRHSMQLLSTA